VTTVRDRERRRLKYAATLNEESLPEAVDLDYELLYIDIGNVDSMGQIHNIAQYRFEDAPSRARRKVKHGDVIISTVRTYLQAIAPIDDPPDNLIVSTGFAVIRPRIDILNTDYCKYALREPRFIYEVEARSTGVSYPAINASDLGDIRVEVPTLPTQQRIADYLDRETAQIDILIKEKERMISLLAEKRAALISLAVIRGLNPDAPLMPSGHAWIGDIPAHWKVKRAKQILRERDERSETGDEELLTVSHITGVTKRSEKEVYMFEAETTKGYKLCSPENLVINTLWAWMGAMGIAWQTGIVSPAYHVYELSSELIPGYVDALVRTSVFAKEVTRFSKGVWSSRLRLYPEGLYEVYLPVPPPEEQQQIIEFIANERQQSTDMEDALKKSIELLKERRSALITAAVTGQIKPETMNS